MSDNKLVALVLAITFFLIGGMLWIYNTRQPVQVAAVAGAKAEVAQTTVDWGQIPINDGKVKAVFAITNRGSETLKLFNGTTSCACTTAQLKRGGEVSPLFGMHAKGESVFEVPAGETAELEMVFDPAFHGPNGLGSVTRQATVQTNDVSQPQLSFTAAGTVVK